MRSVWCTLVAVTLVVAGARVAGADSRHAAQTGLHTAKTAVVAPAVRRARGTARTLDALVGVASFELAAPSRGCSAVEVRVPVGQPRVEPLFVRSSRGPPRA